MRLLLTFLAIFAYLISSGFCILAADEEALSESPSEKSSSRSSEKPDVTPDPEGFYGTPNSLIDDPER